MQKREDKQKIVEYQHLKKNTTEGPDVGPLRFRLAVVSGRASHPQPLGHFRCHIGGFRRPHLLRTSRTSQAEDIPVTAAKSRWGRSRSTWSQGPRATDWPRGVRVTSPAGSVVERAPRHRRAPAHPHGAVLSFSPGAGAAARFSARPGRRSAAGSRRPGSCA